MKVLVIAAHPDDELLGVGGTLIKHAMAGHEVHVLIVAEGGRSRAMCDQAYVIELGQTVEKVSKIIGSKSTRTLGLSDNRLDKYERLDIIRTIEDVVLEIAPEIVYTHHAHDLNIDHQMVYECVRTATRPILGSTVKSLYTFETLSSTEWGNSCFNPNKFIDISGVLNIKLKALAEYEKEMKEFPHPRSLEAVEALAKIRGSVVGLPAAEAFEIIFQIGSI